MRTVTGWRVLIVTALGWLVLVALAALFVWSFFCSPDRPTPCAPPLPSFSLEGTWQVTRESDGSEVTLTLAKYGDHCRDMGGHGEFYVEGDAVRCVDDTGAERRFLVEDRAASRLVLAEEGTGERYVAERQDGFRRKPGLEAR